MTTLRRSSGGAAGVSRADAVRARRKHKETQQLWTGARTVSHHRAVADRSAMPNWKRHAAVRAGTHRWNASAPAMGGLNRMRALADVLPHVELSWRMASLALVMVVGAVLFHFLSSSRYFVNSINLSG